MTNASSAIRGFASTLIDTSRGTIFAYEGGRGPAVLLLHGFPQTGLMWREVAPLLATQFTVVVADMPGYGASAVPADSERHAICSQLSVITVVGVSLIVSPSTIATWSPTRPFSTSYRLTRCGNGHGLEWRLRSGHFHFSRGPLPCPSVSSAHRRPPSSRMRLPNGARLLKPFLPRYAKHMWTRCEIRCAFMRVPRRGNHRP
jgi:hypothetical protein